MMDFANGSVIFGVIIGMLILVSLFFVLIYASRYMKVPPNTAMVIYGKGVQIDGGMSIVTGGGKFIVPILQGYDLLPLDLKTVDIKVKDVSTRNGNMEDNMDIEGVFQYRVGDTPQAMQKAANSVLHKSDNEMNQIVQISLEKSIRSEFSKNEPEHILSDRDGIGDLVKRETQKLLKDYGFIIKTFVIKEFRMKDRTGEIVEKNGSDLTVQCPLCSGLFELKENIMEK